MLNIVSYGTIKSENGRAPKKEGNALYISSKSAPKKFCFKGTEASIARCSPGWTQIISREHRYGVTGQIADVITHRPDSSRRLLSSMQSNENADRN